MKLLSALAGGLAGACAVTLLNEFLKNSDEEAPRLDELGEETVSKSLEAINVDVPKAGKLYKTSLIGDIISNFFIIV